MISSIKKVIKIFFLAAFFSATAYAESFRVDAIQIEGLEHIHRSTVLNYLPIHVGQTLNEAKTADVIQALYDTGFFSDIRLSQEGNTLIVHVVERPVIAEIHIQGNKEIDKEKIETVLKDVGLVEGRIFDNAELERMKQGLINEYHNRGRYNVNVDAKVTPLPRKRVSVTLDITEGDISKIKDITLIGNKAFSTRTLLGELPISSGGLFSFYTHDNYYSEEKLNKALETLQSYYFDRGYLQFKVVNKSVRFASGDKEVFITLTIEEGPYYTVSGYKFTGDTLLPAEKLAEHVTFKAGDAFSRKQVIQSNKRLGNALGSEGYLLAEVNAVPELNEKTKQVFITFHVTPGKRSYVRRIRFVGNAKTADEVLRREMRQFEGGVASRTSIRESLHRLKLLGYFQHEKVKTLPVVGQPDQVDLEYHVEEIPAGGATLGLGYGTDGFIFNAGINQSNFLGTGSKVGIAFERSAYQQRYSLDYNNPYYTDTGIQRGFSFYSTKYTPSKLNITYYTFDTYGGNVNYTIPISEKNDYLQLALGYQATLLKLGSNPSMELLNFVTRNGACGLNYCNTEFNQAVGDIGWSRNNWDRLIFPTRGLSQMAALRVAAPLAASPLSYYKANYTAHWYQPLTHHFILTTLGSVAYGGGFGSTHTLPFFQNYFAGGPGGTISSVRGYASNSIGPADSNGNPLGGNFLATGSFGIIFPNFISPDKLRTTAFIDAGNVYNTRLAGEPPYYPNQHGGPVRFSVGIGFEWRIPMLGVLNFSIQKALNPQGARAGLPGGPIIPGDNLEPFQFGFGTNLL